jgi:hypothetical protein
MSEPICTTCDDTHTMTLRDRDVMCTACPLPCQSCRAGGNGPFCEATPCACACHGSSAASTGPDAHADAIRRAFTAGVDFMRDQAEISEWDGWHRTDPRIEWPLESEIEAARDAHVAKSGPSTPAEPA